MKKMALIKATIAKGILTLEIPIKAELSKSGKMVLMGSTHGWDTLAKLTFKGLPITISANIGVKNIWGLTHETFETEFKKIKA